MIIYFSQSSFQQIGMCSGGAYWFPSPLMRTASRLPFWSVVGLDVFVVASSGFGQWRLYHSCSVSVIVPF